MSDAFVLQQTLPTSSRLVFGCMGLGGSWDAQPVTEANIAHAHAAVEAALEIGITLFDHADIYTLGKAESVFGTLLKRQPALRDRILLQSKCGIRFGDELGPKRYDLSYDYLLASVDGILARLGVDYLDTLLLHRPDALMDPTEVAEAWLRLKLSGKVRHLGVSNMHSGQMALLQRELADPILINQLEMSLLKHDWVENGSCFNDDQGTGARPWQQTLEYCRRHGIALQAWGSLARGWFSGATPQEAPAAVHATAALVRERADSIAAVLTQENGKPLAEAKIETMAAADIIEWFADEGLRVYGRLVPSRNPAVRQMVVKDPVGPVAAFTPWNFPINQAVRKVSAALTTGCSILVKAAEETPAAPAALLRAFVDAGVPAGVVGLVYGNPAEISSYLIPHPVIRKVSFTGSTVVGKQLAALAGQHMKRVTMELGGHAPVIIAEDADLELAVKSSGAAKFRNAGQVCISPTRFLVHESVRNDFAAALARHAQALKVGDGLAEGTQMGPLANPRRVVAMTSLMEDAVERGATVATGGARIGEAGNFFAPTVLTEPREARVLTKGQLRTAVLRDLAALMNAICLGAGDDLSAYPEVERSVLNYGVPAFAGETASTLDVHDLDVDFAAFSGHKLYGPTGIGVLYGKPELLEAMSPWLGGGKMISEVSFDGFTTQAAPWKLEAGTPNVAGVIGLSAALEWLADVDVVQAENWSRGLATLAEDALAKRPGFRSFRCQDSSLLAFDFAGVHHSDMVTLLAGYGIALRAGQHCAQPLLAALGVSGTLRASFAPYNTQSDVEALISAVDRALEILVD